MSENSLAYQGLFRYEQKFLRDDLVLFQQTDYSVIYSGRDNDMLSTSTGFRYDITDDFYLSLQVDYHYETNPASESENADFTYLMVGSNSKLQLGDSYAALDGGWNVQPRSYSVFGVNVTDLETEFGRYPVVLNRHLDVDTVLIVDLRCSTSSRCSHGPPDRCRMLD